MIYIIIPVYNGEKYLHECLNSLKKQTSQNFTAFVSDDGSRDGSYKIMKEYECSNIIIESHENIGVAETRNKLIDKIDNGFMLFLDCDDFLNKRTIEFIEKTLVTNPDLVLFDYTTDYFKNSSYNARTVSHKEIAEKLITLRMRGLVCGKVFSVRIWKNELNFEKRKYCEDWLPIFKYIYNSNKILYIPNDLYFYRQHNASTIHSSNEIVLKNYDISARQICDFLKSNNRSRNSEIITFKLYAAQDELHEIYLFEKPYIIKMYI